MVESVGVVCNRTFTGSRAVTNRTCVSLRIRVEHAIGGVQRLRIVKDKTRNWKSDFRDAVMEIYCALHNFRLKFRR
jgi:hypothetical protein